MARYASTTDAAKQLEYSAIARLSSAEKEYAKFLVSSFQRRGLGFISAPLLFLSWKYIQFCKGNKGLH
jgi:hypothetical protein